jgi:hypothetical protein
MFLAGCYLSTPYDDCADVAAWVSYQGTDCPGPLRDLIPVDAIEEMRARYNSPRPSCTVDIEAEEVAIIEGVTFEFREGEAIPGDEQLFDRYIALVLVDDDRGFDICRERWGLLFFESPCDTRVSDQPACMRPGDGP